MGKGGDGMGVTVNEIAKICGVSRTTVLRALNNQSRVSDRTRRRVLEVAKELGYRLTCWPAASTPAAR